MARTMRQWHAAEIKTCCRAAQAQQAMLQRPPRQIKSGSR